MAVSKDLLEKNLAISYGDGIDREGKNIMKKSTFKNVKSDAQPEALMTVVDSIDPLMPEGISEVLLVENYMLSK
ncbi:DUF1659 domain-containing protein [Clostridium botulinum]|nr:DUF1659 domain-containing protein [Clostridium botulinum]